MINGQPNVDSLSIQPAAIGGSADARLRGTLVTLAAAGRSSGVTTAITYELRAGTSICDRNDLHSRQVTARAAVGMNAVRISRPLAGRWVNTIVRTSPMREAMRTATRAENAERIPAQKN